MSEEIQEKYVHNPHLQKAVEDVIASPPHLCPLCGQRLRHTDVYGNQQTVVGLCSIHGWVSRPR